eukprot:gnl/Dysnectes_brevis/214_a244_2556.p1 GENE.gnl/Dysnectes_brevis/214_a244_2556~~gnl/Dysnectes_brevis/214_a244_2556.p1  ORF type:complete len:661 (+),score=257.87 gnl/Dysnectes_brevis/214_a244_2556:22-2004(+)
MSSQDVLERPPLAEESSHDDFVPIQPLVETEPVHTEIEQTKPSEKTEGDLGSASQLLSKPGKHKESDKISKFRFSLDSGIDLSMSLSFPPKFLVKKAEWIPDNSQDTCTFCQKPFTFFSRKHHCRRCGRLCCAQCSEKGVWVQPETLLDRACLLCKHLLKTNRVSKPPIDPVITDDGLVALLTGDDRLLAAEFLRDIRNCLKYDEARLRLIAKRPEIITQAVELLKIAANATSDVPLTAVKMTKREGNVMLGQALGMLINLTASRNSQPLSSVISAGAVPVVASMLCDERDMVKQELAVWCLRNISRDAEAANMIVELPAALSGLLALLDADVGNVQEFASALIGNMVLANPAHASPLALGAASQTVPQLCRLATGTSPLVQQHALRALGLLAAHNEVREVIISGDSLPAMIKVAVTGDKGPRIAALRAISTLLRHVTPENLLTRERDEWRLPGAGFEPADDAVSPLIGALLCPALMGRLMDSLKDDLSLAGEEALNVLSKLARFEHDTLGRAMATPPMFDRSVHSFEQAMSNGFRIPALQGSVRSLLSAVTADGVGEEAVRMGRELRKREQSTFTVDGEASRGAGGASGGVVIDLAAHGLADMIAAATSADARDVPGDAPSSAPAPSSSAPVHVSAPAPTPAGAGPLGGAVKEDEESDL